MWGLDWFDALLVGMAAKNYISQTMFENKLKDPMLAAMVSRALISSPCVQRDLDAGFTAAQIEQKYQFRCLTKEKFQTSANAIMRKPKKPAL